MIGRRRSHGAAAVILLLVAGCASTPGDAPAAGRGTATPTIAQPTAAPPPTPTASPAGPPTQDTASCPTGTEQITITVRFDVTPTPACLRTGTQARLIAPASPTQPWQPITTTDTHVMSCQGTPRGNTSPSALCTATGPGHATLTIQTEPPADPHGPLQYIWTLPVTVTS